MIAAGKAYRQKGWWTSGNDKLVAYGKDLVVWINGEDTVQAEMVDRLESLLTSKSGKDQTAQNSVGHEDRYWAGTEAGLLKIPEFKGIIYATDGSLSSEGMGAIGTASIGTTQAQEAAAAWGTATRGAPPIGQSTQQRRWPWKTRWQPRQT